MPATTSTQTKPAIQANESLEPAMAKVKVLEMVETNNQAKSTPNQNSATTANRAAVVNNSKPSESATASQPAAPTESRKAAVQTMAQPAQQWRNCRKPHRI